MAEHALHGDDVRMDLAPRQRLDGCIDDVAAVLTHLQHGSHGQTRARVAMVLNDDVGMLVLDHLCELAKERRLADSGHVLEADFLRPGGDLLVGELGVILQCVDRGGSDAERALRGHARLLGPSDGRGYVADVVQTVEDAGNVHSLCVLYAVHHCANVIGHGVHTQRVEAAVEHMRFDSHLIEGLAEGTDSLVRVLTGQQADLLECAAIGLHTGEATHVDDNGSYALQLILTRLEFS